MMEKREFRDDLTDTWFKLGIVFGLISIPVIVIFAIFGDRIAEGGVPCAFFHLVHLYCPGCGGTRSFNHMVHLRFIKSLLCNPFVLYTYADYLIFMINTILVKKSKKLGFKGYPVTITIFVGIGLLLGQWIVRNILLVAFNITCL